MFKTILVLLVGYIIYRLARGFLPGGTSRIGIKKKSSDNDSLDIREEDIQDAEYKDISEKE